VKVELRGLELHGHHGVGEEERRAGQRFLFDVELEVGERGVTDRIEDAVDYREVAVAVREVNARQFRLLEALASAVADTLVERFGVERARVRVRKPEVRPAGVEVEFSAVTVERARPRAPVPVPAAAAGQPKSAS
jgi:dihydroneopterin aldolase